MGPFYWVTAAYTVKLVTSVAASGAAGGVSVSGAYTAVVDSHTVGGDYSNGGWTELSPVSAGVGYERLSRGLGGWCDLDHFHYYCCF